METITQENAPPHTRREDTFVAAVIDHCQRDKGLAAHLRRADNPATEYQSWDFLAGYRINLEYPAERLPFATVAAAIAKAKPTSNGNLGLGRAIAFAYKDDHGNQSDQAKARLRRLLACDELTELCRILRPLLTLIDSRVNQPLDYARVLRQLHQFGIAAHKGDSQWQQNIKAQWAQEFYGQQAQATEDA